MLGQEMTSMKRKQTNSGNPESAKRSCLENDGSIATNRIDGKQRQTQGGDKSESPRIPLRDFPMDVWWNVIDELDDDQNALAACARVCTGWSEKSMRLLGKPIDFKSPSDVRRIAKHGSDGSQKVKSCGRVCMTDYSLRTLGLFATMFAGKMPLLRTLSVIGTEWTSGEVHEDVFHYLSTFASITRLTLYNDNFPSVQTFGRLVSALPGLTTLRIWGVKFSAHDLRPGAFVRRPRKLTTLDLHTFDAATMHDVSDFLVATEMASTLREIVIRWPLHKLDKSGVPALLSSAGSSLRSLNLLLQVDSLPVAGGAPIVDLSALVNLRHLRFAVEPSYFRNEDYLPGLIPWVCDRLTQLPKPSTTLRDFTLMLELGTRPPPEDSAVRHRSYVQHCELLDDALSTPPFMGLEQFVLEIRTIMLKASDKMALQRLAPTRFPKLAARGVFRVVVLCGGSLDKYDIARQRDAGPSYTITDLELPG